VNFAGPLIGGADATTTGYTFTFDKDGVLRKVDRINAQAHTGKGLVN
jgi:hypothetical protein